MQSGDGGVLDLSASSAESGVELGVNVNSERGEGASLELKSKSLARSHK